MLPTYCPPLSPEENATITAFSSFERDVRLYFSIFDALADMEGDWIAPLWRDGCTSFAEFENYLTSRSFLDFFIDAEEIINTANVEEIQAEFKPNASCILEGMTAAFIYKHWKDLVLVGEESDHHELIILQPGSRITDYAFIDLNHNVYHACSVGQEGVTRSLHHCVPNKELFYRVGEPDSPHEFPRW